MEDKIKVSYDCYRSALSDNEHLRYENERLEDIVEQLKKELQEEKADHTMDQSRVIFAHYILNGCRDDKVLIHMDKKAQEVVFWKMKYDKVYSEMEHYKKLSEDYQKSNKAWQEKYDKLFQKHQEALGAIIELERHIDNTSGIKRCCR